MLNVGPSGQSSGFVRLCYRSGPFVSSGLGLGQPPQFLRSRLWHETFLRGQQAIRRFKERPDDIPAHRSPPIFGSWSDRAHGCGGFGVMT
jgi:hypothetical protein